MEAHGIIWDLDGTLADTIADIAAAANAALAFGGFAALPVGAYPAIVGRGSRWLIAHASGLDDDDHIDRMHEEFRRHYAAHALDNSKPFDGIPDVLETMRSRGVPMCVLSNKPHAFTTAMVDALFPRGVFAAVAGQREGRPLKPDPTVAHEQCKTMGLPPERVLLIGDTEIDMETATRGGLRPIGVQWGFRPLQELKAAGAETILNTPAALLRVLDG